MSETKQKPVAIDTPYPEDWPDLSGLSAEQVVELQRIAHARSVEEHIDQAKVALALAATIAYLRAGSANAADTGMEEDANRGVFQMCEDAYLALGRLHDALPGEVHNLKIIDRPDGPEVQR